MRIVLDLQACQTESRFRGMGRYSMSLAQAIAKNAGGHEIWLFLNDLFPDAIPYIRHSFEGLIPKERIFVFSAHGPVAEIDPQNEWRTRAAELVREYALSQIKPDIIHINSLFEGYGDDAVTSIGAFDSTIPSTVTLYDLIPYVDPENSLPNEQIKKWYYRKIQSFIKANIFLAISEYSKKEAIDNLGIAQECIINISAAIDENFKPLKYSEEQKSSMLSRYNIKKAFIMYSPGGFEERKNIKKLIESYSLLSNSIKKDYQLVITGKIHEETESNLLTHAKKFNINKSELIFTGYLENDDLITMYNLCKLFVCPSLHEGFGLPPLEAMACGAPTIGSNRTSIPEVIGRQDALFDPCSAKSISDKISEVLTNEGFFNSLKEHSLQQAKKFSWDKSAKIAVDAFEMLNKSYKGAVSISTSNSRALYRPRLAFLSPLPPEKSGISNYSKELLPELALYYDITIIVDQPKVEDILLNANFPIHDVLWFEANIKKLDRILFQFGNSPFHKHMFSLLKKYSGVVVLHDFYLSSVANWMENSGYAPRFYTQSLYYSHGYNALIFLKENGVDKTKFNYPVNKEVLDNSIGVIVHSQYSIEKAKEYYVSSLDYKFSYIPQLRRLAKKTDYKDIIDIRKMLGFDKDDFLICSFGFLDETKLNHRLLKSFLNSSLSKDKNCHLIFVGENHGGDYGKNISEMIKNSGLEGNIKITGFVNENIYLQYLSICDIAVQLRNLTRGETSRAVLDVLAFGLPLIINAHGPMAEYPENILIKLPDEFDDDSLIKALEKLKDDPKLRNNLGHLARKHIIEKHAPKKIANDYFNAIENFYLNSENTKYKNLINSLSNIDTNVKPVNADIISTSEAIANGSFKTSKRQFFIDISNLSKLDLKTGIERVTRALMLEFLKNPPKNFRVESVYFDGHNYRYARKFTFNFLNIEQCGFNDSVIEPNRNDIFLNIELNFEYLEEKKKILRLYNYYGINIYYTVHDLLPVKHPEWFPPDSDNLFKNWLKMVHEVSSGLLSVSKSTKDDLIKWLKENNCSRIEPMIFGYFHHGADITNSFPTIGISKDNKFLLDKLHAELSFLMVGTIEPRKGYLQVLDAFSLLWQKNININLVIVGKEGWKNLPINQKRTIPLILSIIKEHKELNKHLFWLEFISDEYLERVYEESTCLIAASEGEGFGLPLIEAGLHKLPIIARDIPVFREVAGNYAFYFKGANSEDLAKAIKDWLNLYKEEKHPKSDNMPWLTWKQSAEQLMDVIFNNK